MLQIMDVSPAGDPAIEQAPRLLMERFAAWPTLQAAMQEVRESLGAERINLVAVDAQGGVLGWMGELRQYGGKIWELYPLVVR